jgi:arylsulfatase A-like enzyme
MQKSHLIPSVSMAAGILLACGAARAEIIAHWKFDDGSGTTAVDSANSNNGTLVGSPLPTWLSGVNAKVGGALEFAGIASTAGQGEVNATVTGLPTGSAARTVSLWLWADTTFTDQKFFSYGTNTNGTSFGWSIENSTVGPNPGSPTIFFRHGGGNFQYTGQAVTLNQWNHVAIVVPDGATQTNQVMLYLNGVAVSGVQGSQSARTLNTSSTAVALGGDAPGASNSNLDGRLDDVQIYNTALTPAEVTSLYNNPGSVNGQAPVTTPIAHWKLDDGSGSTAADTAGSNTGTLIGSPLPAWTSGVNGGALEFGGVTNQEVTATVTGLPTGAAPRTISLWLSADASVLDQKFFAYGSNANGASFGWTLEDAGGIPTIFFRHGGGNFRYTGQAVPLGPWVHVAIVVPDGATLTNQVLLYLNGSPVSGVQGDGSPRTLNTASSVVVLGGDYPGGGATNLEGRLDDVRIYNSALTGTEIQALYEAFSVIDETPPILASKGPADGTSGVPITVSPTATFNESVQLQNGGVIVIRNLGVPSGLSDQTITLPDSRVTVSGSSVVINPTGNLSVSTPYAIRISGNAVKDLAGNFYSGIANDTDWNFTTSADPNPTRLNVLFVSYDDLNTWIEPLGEYADVLTPQMNRLAGGGVTFKRAYCQAPICAPSRVSFMSGLRPSTTGEYALGSRLSDHPVYGDGLHKAIHESFKDAGYTTASIGKVYHSSSELGPGLDQGNGSHSYAPQPATKLTIPEVSGDSKLIDWGAYPAEDTQLEDYGFVTWARARIASFAVNPQTPFFMSVGMTQPHVPLFAPQKWFDLYPLTPQRSFARPFYDPNDLDDTPRFARYLHWSLPEPRTERLIQYNEWDNHTRAYLACVSYADMNLGRLLDALDDPNGDGNTADSIREKTIVVMFSDHGYHLGEKGLTAKTTLWDRATRVPVIISAPGMAEGQVCTQPAELLDLYPTLLDLCGLPPYAPLEGISLRPQLQNPTNAPRRPAITTHGPNSHSIVDERYRYTRYADGSEELYDHAIDPNEETNRIGEPNYREVASRLAGFLPTVNAPNSSGNTRIATIGAGGVISWQGTPINDTELGINPAVANFVTPLAGAAAVDSDFDRMPDWWEIYYTESITLLGFGNNYDGDPVPDQEEYLHGTDPTDPVSFLKVIAQPGPGGQSFRHSTVPGRDYRFQTSGTLSGWTTDATRTKGTGADVTRSAASLGLPPTQGFSRVEVLSEADPSP